MLLTIWQITYLALAVLFCTGLPYAMMSFVHVSWDPAT